MQTTLCASSTEASSAFHFILCLLTRAHTSIFRKVLYFFSLDDTCTVSMPSLYMCMHWAFVAKSVFGMKNHVNAYLWLWLRLWYGITKNEQMARNKVKLRRKYFKNVKTVILTLKFFSGKIRAAVAVASSKAVENSTSFEFSNKRNNAIRNSWTSEKYDFHMNVMCYVQQFWDDACTSQATDMSFLLFSDASALLLPLSCFAIFSFLLALSLSDH